MIRDILEYQHVVNTVYGVHNSIKLLRAGEHSCKETQATIDEATSLIAKAFTILDKHRVEDQVAQSNVSVAQPTPIKGELVPVPGEPIIRCERRGLWEYVRDTLTGWSGYLHLDCDAIESGGHCVLCGAPCPTLWNT